MLLDKPSKPSIEARIMVAANLFGAWKFVEEIPGPITSTEIANLLDLPLDAVEVVLRKGTRVGGDG